jgi:hypothetical protein
MIELLLIIHLFGAVVFTAKSYKYIDKIYDMENSFEESNWKRIAFFLLLVLSFIFILGFLIEGMLILIDKKYRTWRFQK